MNRNKMIAIGLCLFLTITPFIGSFISQDTTFGEYVGNFTPYIHFTMPELAGPPFAEAIGGLIGFFIFLIGLIGLLIFFTTKLKKVGGLLLLLYMTILYCGSRIIIAIAFSIFSFSQYDLKTKLFLIAAIFSDFIWGVFCYWSTIVLTIDNSTMIDNNKKIGDGG